MELRSIISEDFVNYHKPSLFLAFPYCSFKCEKECGQTICQNSALIHEPIINIKITDIIEMYFKNPLTQAIVCGGLEPFDSWNDLLTFCTIFRLLSKDTIIIYTGYNEEEIKDKIQILSNLNNIIIKFGRFVPNSPHIYDKILGIELASNNQYAKKIGE